MTAVAYVGHVDRLRRSLDFWIGDESESGIMQVFGDGTRKYTPTGEYVDEPSRSSFTLRDDEARALLQALIRHFDGGEDTRSLRRDYDAERKRVDLLIDRLASPVIITDGRVAQ